MHLLVPGAYRLGYRNSEHTAEMSLNAPSGAGCLPTEGPWDPATDKKRSQCTFWCRVLTNPPTTPQAPSPSRLNAPSDAGCLSTHAGRALAGPEAVSIHRVVLGAYRPGFPDREIRGWVVSIHRVVLGAYRPRAAGEDIRGRNESQYTVWCWVLIDGWGARDPDYPLLTSLNTPCGAGCLSTCVAGRADGDGDRVSIHRVVLGAYRPVMFDLREALRLSQYTVWCWVLIDSVVFHRLSRVPRSQYTVWCWVLIDRRGREAADVG